MRVLKINHMSMNVKDEYKNWSLDLIRDDLKKSTNGFAVMMSHIKGDFNIGTLIRNANAFGAESVFYYGTKRWDKRGALGTYLYTNVGFLKDDYDVELLKKEYLFVAVEQTKDSKNINNFNWAELRSDPQLKPLFIFGEETQGLSQSMLDKCDHCLEIPMYGSVRSLNVGTTSGIVLNSYVSSLNVF